MELNRKEKKGEKRQRKQFPKSYRVAPLQRVTLFPRATQIYIFAPPCATRNNEKGITRTDYTGHETQLGALFINHVPIVSYEHNDAREALPERSVNRLRFHYPFLTGRQAYFFATAIPFFLIRGEEGRERERKRKKP